MAPEDAVRDSFRRQAHWCEAMGSPGTANLCRSLAKELKRSNPIGAAILDWDGSPDPKDDALALRVAGALHHLLLRGRSDLADIYLPHPPTRPEEVWHLVDRAMREQPTVFSSYLASPPQTNEVGRSGALMPGLMEIVRRFDLPLALYEIGSSAGLNLIPDLFGYRFGEVSFGKAASPVQLEPEWIGRPPPSISDLRVVERHGVDQNPVDLRQPDARDRLISYIWHGQPERLGRIRAAIEMALAADVRIERADAADWVERSFLVAPHVGVARVLFHSIVWQYLAPVTKARIEARLEAAGERASAAAPIAWLRLEKLETVEGYGLDLTLWPGRQIIRLAQVHGHGAWVKWLL
jgi:hypothetical protein